MQVTIDSSEPLERVLRVVGALYNVTLSVAEDGAGRAPQVVASAARPGRRAAKVTKAPAGRRGRGTRAKAAAVDAAAVRQWARERGLAVSRRGPLPRGVVDEYAKSVTGG